MKRTLIAILVVLIFSAAQFMWADGEESYGEVNIFDLILGIIENPDPIPQVHWVPLHVDPNSPGARELGERNDGRPAFEFDRETEAPFLTWAYDAGGDHDIAFNEWRKNDWSPRIEFVTSSTVDEVDPRLYVDMYNRLYLTWWEDDADSRMMLVKHSSKRGWGATAVIGHGRRPSVAVWEGDLVVAYERDHALGQEIVFARSHMGGPFVSETVAVTTRTDRLDPIVHVRAGHMWIDWKDADNVIAFSRHLNGLWKMPSSKAWTDPSWLGELTVRHSIELQLTN